jgi:hypothetical protein
MSESQEPVAHLWECLGRWSAYLVNNGTQAECAPPSWLVEAVKNATTPPQRTWVGLDHQDKKKFSSWLDSKTDDEVFTAIDNLLEKLNT